MIFFEEKCPAVWATEGCIRRLSGENCSRSCTLKNYSGCLNVVEKRPAAGGAGKRQIALLSEVCSR